MLVGIRGDLLEKRIFESGIRTQEEAARKAGCSLITYQRVIVGNLIEVKAAKKICDAFGLNLEDYLITDMDDHRTEFSEAAKEACVAAEDAILEILKSHGVHNIEEITSTLVILLTVYGFELSSKNPPDGSPLD